MSMRDLAEAVGVSHQAIKRYEDGAMVPSVTVLVRLSRALDVSVDALLHDESQETPGDLLERMAALEHEQWAHWTRFMLYNLTPENIARWRRQIDEPYHALPYSDKARNREWAVKAIQVIRLHGA
jgi:transcriptional regulator with XRE-family HTH domain